MGLYNTLPNDIDNVDIIVAGGLLYNQIAV